VRREGITCSDPRKAVSPGVALRLPHAPPPAIESGLRTFRRIVDQAPILRVPVVWMPCFVVVFVFVYGERGWRGKMRGWGSADFVLLPGTNVGMCLESQRIQLLVRLRIPLDI